MKKNTYFRRRRSTGTALPPAKTFTPATLEIFQVTVDPGVRESTLFNFSQGVTQAQYEQWTLTIPSVPAPGDYFSFASSGSQYLIYFVVDGSGSDPSVGGYSSLSCNIESTSQLDAIAQAAANVAAGGAGIATSPSGNQISFTNNLIGTTSVAPGYFGSFSILLTQPGIDASTSNYGGFYVYAGTGNGYTFWGNPNSSGSDPGSLGGTTTDVSVPLSGTLTSDQVTSAFSTVVSSYFGGGVIPSGSNLTVIATSIGNQINADVFGSGGVTVSSISNGHAVAEYSNSTYFYFFNTAGQKYYAWINMDGGGVDPALAASIGIQVTISSTNTPSEVAQAFATAILGAGFGFSSNYLGTTVFDVQAPLFGPVTDAGFPDTLTFSPNTTSQGATVVDISANTITVPSHGYLTGQKVRFLSSGTIPAPLVKTSTDYFLIKVDNNTLGVADSLAHATGGTKIDLTTIGNGALCTIQPRR